MMHWQFTPYVIPLILSSAVCVWVAIAALGRRSMPGALPLSLLMLGVAEWSLTYTLELGSPDLPTAVYWDNFTWLGAVIVPAAWLAFVLQYTGRGNWLTWQTVALLTIQPLITLLLVWTNTLHGLLYSSVSLDTSHGLEGEQDIVQELAEAFQFETPPLLEALRVAVLEEHPESLKQAAHNLKGSSHNLGAHMMAELSAELETLGKRGTVEGAAALVTRLEREYQRVCQALASEGAGVK